MEILLENNTENDITPFEKILSGAVSEVLRTELPQASDKPYDAEVSVSIVDEDEIRGLNLQYRGIDSVTDVLSFPMYGGLKEIKQEIKKNLRQSNLSICLGDIVICFSQAERQAAEYGHSLEREIGFLTVHSMLHLLGYDHLTPSDEKEMFEKQEIILSSLNLLR